jgi:mannobiose 2-epimerase
VLLLPSAAALPAPAQPPAEAAALGRKIDDLLRQELTSRWFPAAVDRERGGFHQNFARDWARLPDDSRSLVYQARMTWTAAAFALHAADRRDEFLAYARHGIAYLDEVMRDTEQGGFHWVVGPDGKPTAPLGDEKHVYGTAFVVYAAAVTYGATKDERALKVARDAFDWLEAKAHDAEHKGYFEALSRDGTPLIDWAGGPQPKTDRLGVYLGFKSMNSHIHLLEAVAELGRVDDRPVVRERLAELLAIVRDRIAVEPGALNLYFTRDWRASPAHDSFGHDIETAYLMLEAAHVLGAQGEELEKTRRVARSIVDHALVQGWDAEHGGFYDKGDVFAGAPYDTKKVWWTQAEGLNVLLLMHKEYGTETPKYWDAFLRQWAFIETKMLDPEHGGWFAETTREGVLIGDGRKANPWKAAYHTSRAMMNVSRLLAEIGQQGK